jgi:hypothetical protein
MGEITDVDFSTFVSRLSPGAFTCFRVLFENARERIVRNGPQGMYEIPLSKLMEENGIGEVEAVANSIREIIQCKVDLKKGEFMYFYPFLANIRIEDGIVKYGLHQDVEGVLLHASLPGMD